MLKRITTLAVVILLAVSFNKVFAQVNVTFQIHMGVQMQLGLFNPATDSVEIRGDFQVLAGDTAHYGGNQNWGGYYFLMKKSNTNDSIFTLTVPFPDSAKSKSIQYKFAMTHNGVDTWEGISNRVYTITSDANQQLPFVYFNDRSSVGITVNITFEADMTALLNQGFNPATDSIEVRGDTNPLNWALVLFCSRTWLHRPYLKLLSLLPELSGRQLILNSIVILNQNLPTPDGITLLTTVSYISHQQIQLLAQLHRQS